jgi:hypothetical protein
VIAVKDTPCCNVCAAEGVKLISFSLIQGVTINGRHTTRGAGGITLCAKCWAACQRGRRRQRPRLRVIA